MLHHASSVEASTSKAVEMTLPYEGYSPISCLPCSSLHFPMSLPRGLILRSDLHLRIHSFIHLSWLPGYKLDHRFLSDFPPNFLFTIDVFPVILIHHSFLYESLSKFFYENRKREDGRDSEYRRKRRYSSGSVQGGKLVLYISFTKKFPSLGRFSLTATCFIRFPVKIEQSGTKLSKVQHYLEQLYLNEVKRFATF